MPAMVDGFLDDLLTYCETADGEEPFAVLTKSFGEFIGAKNCAYIDTNNCPLADVFLHYPRLKIELPQIQRI